MVLRFVGILLGLIFISGCSKSKDVKEENVPSISAFELVSTSVNNTSNAANTYTNVVASPEIKLAFSIAVDRGSITGNILFNESTGVGVPYTTTFENEDKTVILKPQSSLQSLKNYTIIVSSGLKSKSGKALNKSTTASLQTGLDQSDKFPIIPDDELLNLVQKQTFKYFWDFGHPVSGLARERNTSGDVVTSGGSGFGVMAIIVAIHRNFISRAEGLERIEKMVDFLQTKAQRFHGAYPHWLNGLTGVAVPFSPKDDGADLVETSYLIQGLLTARQYFDQANVRETQLRAGINNICNAVEWSWFRKNTENVLYWHWSPNYNWDMNMQIQGWNECLITYVLAASSTTYPITKLVYDIGWARNGAIRNGNSYYGVQLPLGPANGGPLFFAHYSFLGINPTGLTDAYANYETQNKAHSLINYNYCTTNPRNFVGYSASCWGLTASDDVYGYAAHHPDNDNGVISPTAALSSFPYTPAESMQALKFFYYKLGDRLWGEYGFYDAFSIHHGWFANSYLAIDQGPIIIMIENYRSALLWNLFMSCPEVKNGMKNLGFQSPNL